MIWDPLELAAAPGSTTSSLLPPARAFDSHSKRMDLWQKIKPQEAKRKQRREETAMLFGRAMGFTQLQSFPASHLPFNRKVSCFFWKRLLVKMEPAFYMEFCVNAQKFPSRGFWDFCFFPRTCYKLYVLNIGWITAEEELLGREIHTNSTGKKEHFRGYWTTTNINLPDRIRPWGAPAKSWYCPVMIITDFREKY